MVFDIYTRLTYTCFQEIASECKKHIHEAFPVYSLQVHANDTNNSNFLLWIPNQKVIITFHQTVLQLASVHWKPHLLTWFDIIRVMSVKHKKVSFRKLTLLASSIQASTGIYHPSRKPLTRLNTFVRALEAYIITLGEKQKLPSPVSPKWMM